MGCLLTLVVFVLCIAVPPLGIALLIALGIVVLMKKAVR